MKCTNQNILITGASGYVGTHLINYLIDKDEFNLNCIIRNKKIKYSNDKNINFFISDLKNIDKDSKCFKNINCVVHLAFPNSKSKIFAKDIDNEIKANLKFIRAIKINKIKKIIYISSSKLINFNDKDKLNGFNGYEICKLKIELVLIKECKDQDIDLIIVRPGVVYGPDSINNLNKFINLIKNRFPIPILKKNIYKNIVFINILTENLYKLIVHKKNLNKLYYIYEKNITLYELISIINMILNKKMLYFFVPNILIKLLKFTKLYHLIFGSLYDSFHIKDKNYNKDFNNKFDDKLFIDNLKYSFKIK